MTPAPAAGPETAPKAYPLGTKIGVQTVHSFGRTLVHEPKDFLDSFVKAPIPEHEMDGVMTVWDPEALATNRQ